MCSTPWNNICHTITISVTSVTPSVTPETPINTGKVTDVIDFLRKKLMCYLMATFRTAPSVALTMRMPFCVTLAGRPVRS